MTTRRRRRGKSLPDRIYVIHSVGGLVAFHGTDMIPDGATVGAYELVNISHKKVEHTLTVVSSNKETPK